MVAQQDMRFIMFCTWSREPGSSVWHGARRPPHPSA